MATKRSRRSKPSQACEPQGVAPDTAPGAAAPDPSALGGAPPAFAAAALTPPEAPPSDDGGALLPQAQPVTAIPRSQSDPILSPEQRLALEGLTLGRSIKSAARDAGVARSTLYRWLSEDADFRAAYNTWRQEIEFSARSRLAGLANKACDVVGRALDESDARTAMSLLKGLNYMSPSPAGPIDPGRVQRRMDFETIRSDTRQARSEDRVGHEVFLSGMGTGPEYYREAARRRRDARERKKLPKPEEKKEG